MHVDAARELKARILTDARYAADARVAGAPARPLRVAVGLAPAGPGQVGVAVRLESADDRKLLPDLGVAAEPEVDVRVIGPIRALTSPAPAPAGLQRPVRPVRPGLSVGHPSVTAGTIGGFVWLGGRLAVLSNNHVLAASDAAAVGDPVLQPGPADGGTAEDRIGSLTAFERFTDDGANLVDAAVAVLDDGIGAEPGNLPGGPLTGTVLAAEDIDPDVLVEKVGRTTGHTRGRISAVEVDGVAVQYDGAVHTFDDQVEIEGLAGGFSAGGDSGSVIWRSADRAPLALLFAGSDEGGTAGGGVTFANPLATVLATFGVEWVSS
ncbi:hypothetical protein [Geodermatophilus sp. URMC 64]